MRLFRSAATFAAARHRPVASLALAAWLALASAAVGAQGDRQAPDDAPASQDDSADADALDEFAPALVAADVEATQIPGLTARQLGKATTLNLAARLDTSRSVIGDANRPAAAPLVAPTRAKPTSVSARPIRVDRASISAPASQVQIIDGQSVELHADGLPGANGPSRDPLAPVTPRAVNPADVVVGARWGAQDRISAPVLSAVSFTAQADVLAGAPATRAPTVRRSLRVTAQWDNLDDLTLGLTPGVQRGGGTSFEHYIAGLQASTLDATKEARWRSFVEVAGEKLAPRNIVDNTTATVRAGASYQTSRSTQLDVSVTRGTTAVSDTQSSVGLSVRF